MTFQKGRVKTGGRKKKEATGGKAYKPKSSTRAERLAPSLASAVDTVEPIEARDGIAPKALMLETMRGAWAAAHARKRDCVAVEEQIAAAVLLGRDAAEIGALKDQLVRLQMEVGTHITLALETAKAVAPFEHPKLAQQDNKIAGELTIIQRKF